MASADYTVVNPEQPIATLDSDNAELVLELNIGYGTGYKVADSSEGLSIGTIPIDAVFTPVRKVNYTIEQVSVGHRTDYENLILEVWTDGSITPPDAVKTASKVLVDHFLMVSAVTLDPPPSDQSATVVGQMPADLTIIKLRA